MRLFESNLSDICVIIYADHERTGPDDSDDHGRVVHSSSKDYQYVLTYQDKEGDWMMVGDVPWEKDHIIIIIIIYDSSI